jgi:transposase
LAETIGSDGFQLLTKIYADTTPPWIRELPAVDILRRVWLQQFYGSTLPVRWRTAEDLPPSALLICSPYDVEARYAKKRRTEWTGYKVHVTETCEPDAPNLITNVETTPAPVSDFDLPPVIHTHLADRGLLPDEHIVDSGYMTADHIVTSQKEHGVDLVGPVADDASWQGKSQSGFDVATFGINWDQRIATCPQGHTSVLWMPGQDRHDHPVINIRFARKDCLACAVREKCTHSPTQPRMLTVRTQECHEALQTARQRQTTEAFKETYASRAGIEGTISQGTRRGSLRCARYIGLAKTHLQQLLMATAINLLRVGAWLLDIPRAQTRRSPFAALASATG